MIRAAVILLLYPLTLMAQAVSQPAPQGKAPTVAEVRAGMGIPSNELERGQTDTVGYASRPDQMAKLWEVSATPPSPEKLGDAPPAGVAAVICPHDDFMYAGRVYRQVLPLVTAKTVVL